MNLEFWKGVVLDTAIDAVKIFPFLFITYFFMEYLEHRTRGKSVRFLGNSGIFGPVIGAATGLIPQCGFSAAASNLYAARVISTGSLIAVYLSTSDEMLPLLVSNHAELGTILKILLVKLLIGMIIGIVIDIIATLTGKGKRKSSRPMKKRSDVDGEKGIANRTGHARGRGENTIHDLCEREHCDCGKDGIFVSALKHSLRIIAFIIVISFFMNVFMSYIGEAGIQYVTIGQSYGVILLASLFGLLPNCAVSVALTQLYLGGMIGEGALMSGLLVGAGVGLLVLVRVNRPFKDTVKIICILWIAGFLAGCIIKALGLSFM